MNRRELLSSLLAAFVIDPERLLWVPGQKHISLPTKKEIIGILCQRGPRGMDYSWKYKGTSKVYTNYSVHQNQKITL